MSGIYLGLGGNLGAVARTFGTALEHFERSEWLRVVSSSRLWRSPAWGFEGPDFLNAVVEIQTDRSPQRLLDDLLAYEVQCGRVRAGGMGSRPIDLDLLAWAGVVADEPGLCLPHPGTPSRRFVLEPVHDIAPQLSLAAGQSVHQLVEQARRDDARVSVVPRSGDWRAWSTWSAELRAS